MAKRQEEQEAASRRMQEEADKYKASTSDLSNGIFGTPYDRQVGMKSKRVDDDNDDIDWEEAAPSGKFSLMHPNDLLSMNTSWVAWKCTTLFNCFS